MSVSIRICYSLIRQSLNFRLNHVSRFKNFLILFIEHWLVFRS